MYRRYGKRACDAALSAAGILCLAAPLALVAAWIKLDSKGPVLFRQRRVGKGKAHFTIYKFRTMRADAPSDVATHLVEDAERLYTRAGRILRRLSIDELPQLVNILKGEMSFVGPRPALWNQFDLIGERDARGANDVVPGLTGWAQVNSRGELPIPVKAAYDGEYASKVSLKFDLLCAVRTLRRGKNNADPG